MVTKYNITEPASCIGVGLRDEHLSHIITHKPKIGWFEVLADNLFSLDERSLQKLEALRSDYPFSFHSVGTSIGSIDELDMHYLQGLKALINRFEPFDVSEHLCWSGVHGVHLHDLFPLPFTEETIAHVVQRVDQIQSFLGRQILLENVSSYHSFEESQMPEWEFVTQIAMRSESRILLDVNNIFINSKNHHFNAKEYINEIPGALVGEMHLGGGEQRDGYILDSHSTPIWDEVWELYEHALCVCGAVPSLIEWDNDIPEFSILEGEALKATQILARNRDYEKLSTDSRAIC